MKRGRTAKRRNARARWGLPLASIALAIGAWAIVRGGSGTAQTAAGAGYEVLARYPHDTGAYTQGLFFDDGFLIEGTGIRGRSSLRRVEIETGTVVEELALPAEYFGEGVASIGNRIFQLTWTSGLGFIYDKDTFRQVGQFRYPGEGWGLTTDGDSLILSDGTSSLRFLDPTSFVEQRRVEVRQGTRPVTQLNELEFINGEVYANIWFSNRIVRISPETGDVLGELDLTPLRGEVRLSSSEAVLNGIAYDAATNRVFVTGKLWPTLFVLRVDRTR
jgi:glutamine cyclotransferase